MQNDTITNGDMILRYFTDQTMTQNIQHTDTDIKLITKHLNKSRVIDFIN